MDDDFRHQLKRIICQVFMPYIFEDIILFGTDQCMRMSELFCLYHIFSDVIRYHW